MCLDGHEDSHWWWRCCRDPGWSERPASEAPRSMACEPGAWRSQWGETASLMPALAAARLTMALTLRSVSLPPPIRLRNTASLLPASPRRERRARLTISGSSTWAHLAALAQDR
jgi:hypothetical protein